MDKGLKIIVTGKVQGVAFRYYTKMKADELGIVGTVQNLPNGSVTIDAYGSGASISTFADWCAQHGSPPSIIDHAEVSPIDIEGSIGLNDFSIIR